MPAPPRRRFRLRERRGCRHAARPRATPASGPGADIAFDEEVDTGPDFSGFVIIDNIDINGTLIGR